MYEERDLEQVVSWHLERQDSKVWADGELQPTLERGFRLAENLCGGWGWNDDNLVKEIVIQYPDGNKGTFVREESRWFMKEYHDND